MRQASVTMGPSVADVLLLLLLLISTGQVYGASFYGRSYIHLRTTEASIQNSLHVRFRTPSQAGVLFLAAGHRDFLLLELISGYLQVRLDLGSGERLLRSEKGIRLSDMGWHTVELKHDKHNVTMTVDQNSHTSLRIPGPDLELSVVGGLFVGSAAGLKNPYLLSTSTGFRGCADDVVFNDHNLLANLRLYSGYKRVHEVTLGCDLQFSATEEDPISFSSPKAFVSLPPWEVSQEGSFECELHPPAQQDNALVLYSSGNQGEFVAIEIIDGHLVTTIGNGKGSKTELHSLTNVRSSHSWYPVQLHLLPYTIQLQVDQELIKADLSLQPQVVQLKGSLFLGGVDEKAHAEAQQAGLMSVLSGGGGSFKGCLRDIRVNDQRTGLPHAVITKDINVGCGAEKGRTMLNTSDPTSSPVMPTDLTPNNKTIPNFLFMTNLAVDEGGRAPLEPKHIKVNLKFRKLGMHPSQFRFHIEKQPVHGQLLLDLTPDHDGKLDVTRQKIVPVGSEGDGTFNMLDLWQGRVMYVQGGSEDQSDFFMFSVSLNTKKQVPAFLKTKHLYRFDISISPVNDAPVLSVPEGNLFTLLENSKRQLTTDLLRVSDPDTSPAELVFSSLGDLVTEAGHIEHKDYPNRPINKFSLHDLENGKIIFVHSGVSTTRLSLRASDGQNSSNTVVLQIVAVPLEHKLVHNAVLEVNQGEARVVTTNHLAVLVNLTDLEVDIRYNITELPRYGALQRLHSSGEWKLTTSFSQKLLEKERIRYLNTYQGVQKQKDVTDQFKCKISINSAAAEEIIFPIVVHWIHFKVTRSKMEVSGVKMAVVTPEDLHAVSKGVRLNESNLFFRILTIPKKGRLLLENKALRSNSTFSQKNITDGLVKYELYDTILDDTRDIISFQVFSAHASSISYDFRIQVKPELAVITVVNEGLVTEEGGSKIITKDMLFTESNHEVQYTITKSPMHGQLRKINLSNSSSMNDNVAVFTNRDILEKRIMYIHDDSETTQDSFRFQVAVHNQHKHDNKKEDTISAEHTFNVSVELVNDQRPVRVVNKVFHVARDGQRLVTLKDLRYRDDDSDFEDSWLVYTRRGVPMGELVLSSNPTHKLFEFTQRDIEQKKVLFVHRGVSYGRFVLFISDGKHYVSTLLEVMAQDPYLQVEKNSGLLVQRSGITALTSANLSVFSNLDIRDPQEVTFDVFLPPKHGALCFNDSDCDPVKEADGISTFTQRDLEAGRLVYHHDGSHELSDWFNVTARVKEKSTGRQVDRRKREVRLNIGVLIKIYLESHQRQPTVLNNRPVVVDEGQNVSISKECLEVIHEDSQPSEILFTVLNPPSLGLLQWTSPVNKLQNIHVELQFQQDMTDQHMTSFTQNDVNQGFIIYNQQTAGGSNDSILLEATNGITNIGPIVLEIDIIPTLLPLKVSDLILDEGSALPLTTDIIKVASHHYSDMNFLYQVLAPPRHGHLEHSRIPGMPITAFTHTEVEREYISYIHDGSDTQSDNFTIMANQTEMGKHSLPCTIHINITPVNDEIPVITTNRGLKVWVGSVTEITIDDLSAEDLDTPSEGLQFVVTPPSNGHLALKSASSWHILNFTQNHIQSGQLVFVHSGALTGGFHFQVNDGVNFAPRQIFSTTARSLVLTLHRNHPIEVYPGSVTPISDEELHADTNDIDDSSRNHTVVFSVTSPPKLGRLLRRMPDNSTQSIATFTQRMVNDGVILYDQNKPETVGWLATDSFSFTVSSPPALLPPRNFTVLISYLANEHHDNPQHNTRLLNNAGAVVAEGGRVRIDRSKLDASNLLGKVPEPQRKDHLVLYRVISLPRHGSLSIQGHNLTRETPDFTQITLNKFGITYVHDDSETTSDSFTFQAWVAPLDHSSSSSSLSSSPTPSESSFSPHTFSRLHSISVPSTDAVSGPRARINDSLAVLETFNITVTPVNDHPPLIGSRSPSTKVVVGERVVLGQDNLQVEDHDTPPEELHYLVISKPNNGYLTLGERPEPVTSFTQYDVNHGRLHFTQQGEASTGVFYFNVTDGHHRPLYKLFTLEVIKPSVSIVNNTGLSLVQGRTAVVLTTNQLAARTNGRSQANITYTVTAPPHHGRIAINDQEVSTFCHEDLLFGRVVYHMTDLSESEDVFQISVSASSRGVDYGNVTSQTVNVTVLPLIHLREPVRVPSGIAVKLGKAMIDASELARISRVDPVFEVLSPPKHGKLVKMTYDPNQASEVLKSFTFRDVVQGRVAIEEILSDDDDQPLHDNQSALTTALGHAPATPLNDSFVFLLRAGNVQPAKGELHFTILPHHQMHHGPGGLGKEDGAGHKHATTRLPTHNKTTSGGGRGGGRGGSTTHSKDEGVGLLPHILSHKTHHNRTHHRPRTHNRWGNHTRHGEKPGSAAEGAGDHTQQPSTPFIADKRGPESPPDVHPVHYEIVPRPAADPLLIILPLLSCLLLIVILVVLILVFRHRKEKQARLQLIQELAAAVPLSPEDSPYLGRPERSVAMPSVVVTPLSPASCPTSPRVPLTPGRRRRRRKSLGPGMTFWGPVNAEADGTGGNGSLRGGRNNEKANANDVNARPTVSAGFKISVCQSPPLRHNQYWV